MLQQMLITTVNIYGGKKTTVIRSTLQTVCACARKGTSKEAIKRFVTFTVVTLLCANKQMLTLDAFMKYISKEVSVS